MVWYVMFIEVKVNDLQNLAALYTKDDGLCRTRYQASEPAKPAEPRNSAVRDSHQEVFLVMMKV